MTCMLTEFGIQELGDNGHQGNVEKWKRYSDRRQGCRQYFLPFPLFLALCFKMVCARKKKKNFKNSFSEAGESMDKYYTCQTYS